MRADKGSVHTGACLIAFTLLAGCASQTTSSGNSINAQTYSLEAMEDAKAVGIRTDGVYVQTNGGMMTKHELGKMPVVMGQTYGLIRFCPNGMVLSSSTVAPANSLKALAEKIGEWFYCESDLSALSRSAFRVDGEKITYRARSLQGTTNTTLVVETNDAGFNYLKVTHSVKFKSRTKIKSERPDFWNYAFFADAE